MATRRVGVPLKCCNIEVGALGMLPRARLGKLSDIEVGRLDGALVSGYGPIHCLELWGKRDDTRKNTRRVA